MQLGHSIVSLLCDFRDLNHMGDLVDHPSDGRRIVMDHRLLVPFDAQGFQGSPVLLLATDSAANLLDGDLLNLFGLLLSHDAPPEIPRECHARRPPARP